jgi:hypothetical protein
MTKDETVRKMVGLLLRNAEKTNSTGLYNGKTGLSFSLFVASKYLQDESVEDIAYQLLQESLIIRANDTGFEGGLSGIGYALLYLIENEYLEADFDEIFGEQYETVIKSFETIEKEPLRLVNSLQVIYFLSKRRVVKKEDERIEKIIKKIFEGLELFLTIQFHDFTDIHYINRKADVLNIYSVYLKLVDYSGYSHFSRVLLEDYAALYRKAQIVSSLETGFYLSRIVEKYSITGYEDIINENIANGINNIHISTLSLKERVDFAKIIDTIQCKEIKRDNLLPDVESFNKDKAIRDLLRSMDEKSFPFGYGYGLGRLLIYYAGKDVELV